MAHSKKTIDKINWLDTSLYAFWRGFYKCAEYSKGDEKINQTIVIEHFIKAYKIEEDEYSFNSLMKRLSNVIYTFDENPFKCD